MAASRIYREWLLKTRSVDELTEPAEILWWRLWLVADDYGRYYADGDHIRMASFPVSPKRYNSDQIDGYLGEFEAAGLVRFYTDDGTEYLEIQRFDQRTKYKSKFPAPPWWTKTVDSATAQQPREPGQSPAKAGTKPGQSRADAGTHPGTVGVVVVDVDEGEDGGVSPSPSISSTQSTADPQTLKKRINSMLGRGPHDPWNYMQDSALYLALAWEPELWDLLEEFYAAPGPREDDRKNPLCLRRSSLTNFLEGLTDEVGKARQWKTQQERSPATAAGNNTEPPIREWKAVADRCWSDGWPRTKSWPQLTPGQRAEVCDFYASESEKK